MKTWLIGFSLLGASLAAGFWDGRVSIIAGHMMKLPTGWSW